MKKYLPVLILIILGTSCRILPHPANFAPIGAIALFGAMYLPKKWLILPLLAMLISDFFIGFYSLPIMFSVYGSFALIGIIGIYVKKNKKFRTILGGTVLGSILFFLITNWAVWAFGAMYAPTMQGLMTSYYMALPFFRNTLFGDLFYTSVLVVIMELLIARSTVRQVSAKI
ncbi:MAG: DUF6580 family putative transport protein [bacterium]